MMVTTLSAIGFLLLIGAVVPLLAWMSRRALEGGLSLPKLPLYAELVAIQAVLAGVSIVVARIHGIVLFPPPTLRPAHLVAGGALLVVAFLILLADVLFADRGPDDPLFLIAPRTGRQKLAWAGLSLAVAFAEEITYRGVTFALLLGFLGEPFAATLGASVLFGLAHLVQGWSRSTIVMLFGLSFQLLVLYTGSLYVAIAVHFIYDVVAGLVLEWQRRRIGDRYDAPV